MLYHKPVAQQRVLRDIPEQDGFPEAVEWPVEPEVGKAVPDPVDEFLDTLLEAGRLTQEEYNVITGVNAEERKDA